jgi:hypothetical protein
MLGLSPMTPKTHISRRKNGRLIGASIAGLLATTILAGINGWIVWHDFEAYRRSSENTGIDASVTSTEIRKLTLWGMIKFSDYRENIHQNCVARVALGSGSEYLKYTPGTIIKIIPRLGCDDPIVISNAKIPISGIMLSVIYLAGGLVAFRSLRSALRHHSA